MALNKLVQIRDPLLQQISTAGGAFIEQRQRVLGVGVLAEHYDAN